MAMVSDTALEAVDVHRSYRLGRTHIPVLAGVCLSVPKGGWAALIGASGCGKSTLLHLLGALDKPDAGQIHCHGQILNQLSAGRRTELRREHMGFVFQSYHLFPELTALENVMLPAMRWGADPPAVTKRATGLLESFGLAPRLEHRPMEMSGGEQQRVALARALINNPSIILADEPTGNLDAAAAAEIMAILQRLNREDGKTIVMVTHDLKIAAQAHDVWRLAAGKAVNGEL